MSVLAGFSEQTKKDIAREAKAAAKARGYCDEVDKVLKDLGLPTEFGKTKTYTVEIEVFEPENRSFSASVMKSRYNDGRRDEDSPRILSVTRLSDSLTDPDW